LFQTGLDPNIDSLVVLGNVLEEFMDLPPDSNTPEFKEWKVKRTRVETALEENGLRYFRFGRILPQGDQPEQCEPNVVPQKSAHPEKPSSVEELLTIILRGLRRTMHPLTHRRKDAQQLEFSNEYDVQDLLHAMLRP
jgi:hypothetical protein